MLVLKMCICSNWVDVLQSNLIIMWILCVTSSARNTRWRQKNAPSWTGLPKNTWNIHGLHINSDVYIYICYGPYHIWWYDFPSNFRLTSFCHLAPSTTLPIPTSTCNLRSFSRKRAVFMTVFIYFLANNMCKIVLFSRYFLRKYHQWSFWVFWF